MKKYLHVFICLSIIAAAGNIHAQNGCRPGANEFVIDGVRITSSGSSISSASDIEIITGGIPMHYGGWLSSASRKTSPSSKYWIFFTDKNNSVYSRSNPGAFLSQRAIDRRNKSKVGIENSDLPVSEFYLNQLNDLGIEIICYSRWMNAVSAYLSDEDQAMLSQLPFVKQITPVKKYITTDRDLYPSTDHTFNKTAETQATESVFGFSDRQITMINLDTIFELGYTGEGMIIAQLDAGFFGVDTGAKYQSLWDKDQIIGYYNFPDHNNQVFNIYSGYHGAWVLSVMGSEIEDEFSGSAPDAQFYLFRTEIADSEYVVEEDYWMMAAEKADSVGADIINSSLGYTEFDDSTTDHTYADLDGNTTLVTIAADMAAHKGILVCNSAGNEGWNAWHYISAPSDGDSVFCIGAVDSAGNYAGFSGSGPSADGDVKPNVAAMGVNTACLDPGGFVTFLSGTSLSSPVMAGACASLWSAFPDRTNMQIMSAVERSASRYLNPNDSIGYGIPNFGLAYEILLAETPVDTTEDTIGAEIMVWPNPAGDWFNIMIIGNENEKASLNIFNMQGDKIYEQYLYLNKNQLTETFIHAQGLLSSGLYIVEVSTPSSRQNKLFFVK